MWRELLLALVLAASNFVIHALGMYALLPGLLRAFQPGRRMKLVRGLWIFLRFIAALMTLHFLYVSVWAEFYVLQRCFPDRETAYYFSLTSYTTVGYGDEVIPHSWRLMGGLEAMTGGRCYLDGPRLPSLPSSSASEKPERGDRPQPERDQISSAEHRD